MKQNATTVGSVAQENEKKLEQYQQGTSLKLFLKRLQELHPIEWKKEIEMQISPKENNL